MTMTARRLAGNPPSGTATELSVAQADAWRQRLLYGASMVAASYLGVGAPDPVIVALVARESVRAPLDDAVMLIDAMLVSSLTAHELVEARKALGLERQGERLVPGERLVDAIVRASRAIS